MAAMRLRYDIVDVFTDRPFAGNQLAVVHGAGGLTTEQCLALAREFNYSESTFPVPGGEGSGATGAAEYTTRIFTPGGEIPFAGHPTLGTAWVLRSRGEVTAGPGGTVTQHCGAGPIGVRFDADLVELSATPRDLLGPVADELAAAILADLGLSLTDLTGPVYVAGCGLSFVHVPVVDDAVGRAHVSTRPLADYVPAIETRDPFEGINLFSASGTAPGLEVHSRVFVPGLSVPEDPATGSAAVGLGVALVAAGLLPEGGHYDITQGVEMGRPSRLAGRVEVADGGPGAAASLCHVAGQVQHVASGEIAVPPA
jgi:trans-2,3-dihydro-3-hydroxyanthranilate isomerase